MSYQNTFVKTFFALFATLSVTLCADNHSRSNRITPTVRAVAQVMPSVVNINTEKLAESARGQSLLERKLFALHPENMKATKGNGYSLGSGTIIDSRGLVITNAHVVNRAIRIKVTLSNGARCEAIVIAQDEINDLALLRITSIPNGASLKTVKMAEPGDVILGETVIVVGNPFGLGNSISRGILSAIGRKVTYNSRVIFADLLQSDAAVYPGNSGGPLINLNGQMIGISTAILKGTEDINFAIPLERVQNVLAKWLIPERFRPVSLGIIPGVKRQSSGRLVFFIRDVMKNTPAWNAGLKPGTGIVEFNNRKINSLMDISHVLWQLQLGDHISITLADGKKVSLSTADQRLSSGRTLSEIKLGISVQPLKKTLARALNYPFRGGMVVSGTKSFPDLKKVNRGDLLLRVGDTFIHNEKNLAQALWNIPPGTTISADFISISKRNGRYYFTRKSVPLKVQ